MDVVVGARRLRFPKPYKAAKRFMDRLIAEGRSNKIAARTLQRDVTYAQLVDSVNRFGNSQVTQRRTMSGLCHSTDAQFLRQNTHAFDCSRAVATGPC